MPLKIYNTLSRKKEFFEPLNPDHIRIYVCGPTVYQYAHIGNARPVVVFGVLSQLLKYSYKNVTYVRNITDVDDKINKKAFDTQQTIRSITDKTIKSFHQDMKALGDTGPDIEPRATDHIENMVDMIKVLIKKKHAYVSNGHVLFHVPSMKDYGHLSKRNRKELIAGARVEVAPYKVDPADFVLWKPSTEKTPGWDSPWGRGRPGWHIECSAMSAHYLGKEFDIHAGGQDLIFPHHENELAQSRCSNDTAFLSKYWMHNGHVMVEGKKMSKSLGNYYTVNELLKEFPGEALRLTLLKTQYRQPLNFTKTAVRIAKRELDGFYSAIRKSGLSYHSVENLKPVPMVLEALNDDLNVPKAISELHRLANLLNRSKNVNEAKANGKNLLASGKFLGLLCSSPGSWFEWKPDIKSDQGLSNKEIDSIIAERQDARKQKHFERSDKLRLILEKEGIILEDNLTGTTWRRR